VRLVARQRLGERGRQRGAGVGGGLGHALNLRRPGTPVKQPRRVQPLRLLSAAPARAVG
jgi:hypothetical protein